MAQTFEEKLQRLKNTEDRRLGISEEELLAAGDFCEEYKKFLNQAKTERETIKESVALAKAAGFVEYVPGISLKPLSENGSCIMMLSICHFGKVFIML